MSKFIELKKEKIGSLIVLIRLKNNKYGSAMWLCKCKCGKFKKIQGTSLLNGSTHSCGCLAIKLTKQRSTIHGMRNTLFYNIWRSMKKRCNLKSRKDYKCYGGRGITYDSRWENFLGFKEDMYFQYLYAKINKRIKRPSLERKDVNGNYCKKNCTWIPLNNQQKNQTTTVKFIAITPDKRLIITKNTAEFGRKYNIPSYTIRKHIKSKKEYKEWKFIKHIDLKKNRRQRYITLL